MLQCCNVARDKWEEEESNSIMITILDLVEWKQKEREREQWRRIEERQRKRALSLTGLACYTECVLASAMHILFF